MLRVHGCTEAAMYRMYCQDTCSRRILSTCIHAGANSRRLMRCCECMDAQDVLVDCVLVFSKLPPDQMAECLEASISSLEVESY